MASSNAKAAAISRRHLAPDLDTPRRRRNTTTFSSSSYQLGYENYQFRVSSSLRTCRYFIRLLLFLLFTIWLGSVFPSVCALEWGGWPQPTEIYTFPRPRSRSRFPRDLYRFARDWNIQNITGPNAPPLPTVQCLHWNCLSYQNGST